MRRPSTDCASWPVSGPAMTRNLKRGNDRTVVLPVPSTTRVLVSGDDTHRTYHLAGRRSRSPEIDDSGRRFSDGDRNRARVVLVDPGLRVASGGPERPLVASGQL